jgi:cobalt-zinc-cadmium efflux system membrane fusion protein
VVSTQRSWLGRLGVGSLFVATGFAAVAPDPAPPAEVLVPDPPTFEDAVDEILTVPGRITFDDPLVAHVFSPLTGRVVMVRAWQGQRVAKGEPLAKIESLDVDPPELRKAQADVIAAQHDWQRQKALCATHDCRTDLDAAADRLRDAKAMLAALQIPCIDLEWPCPSGATYTTSSPLDGEVLYADAAAGRFVEGTYSGAMAPELFVIGTLDRVWVLLDVDEVYRERVKLGASVVVRTYAFPGEAFEGRVEWVSPQADPLERVARVRCSLANHDRALRPGMLCTAEIAARPSPP